MHIFSGKEKLKEIIEKKHTFTYLPTLFLFREVTLNKLFTFLGTSSTWNLPSEWSRNIFLPMSTAPSVSKMVARIQAW